MSKPIRNKFITSDTVFLVLVALLLGGVLLRDFALALLIGVVVGSCSSIFVASPLVYLWGRSQRLPAAGARQRTRSGR